MSGELANAAWRRATKTRRVGIRDSEAPEKPPSVVRAAIWDAFIDGARKGEFNF
ncbi:DUF397 domain-containing protein [Nonomuraea sp. NPDC049725]|uniref:DUF397 domain-containing protein n=1 Tax=Nonomuraea sp. NPDC049725 TaxID=3154508 RepID=UPI0034439E7A